ncbi:hypothetical protein BSPWISOXPB_27 [uncultured Gammaproteobacteria bacterium]|nr:hypothetical protein BSPWISOXPB_27 [uncultured Gammaproteobacteria bacterium]
MLTLKKPFALFLILSYLNAFVLGGVGNVYAANQEVNTAKSLQTFVNATANRVLNISSVQDSKSVQMKSSPSSGNIQIADIDQNNSKSNSNSNSKSNSTLNPSLNPNPTPNSSTETSKTQK